MENPPPFVKQRADLKDAIAHEILKKHVSLFNTPELISVAPNTDPEQSHDLTKAYTYNYCDVINTESNIITLRDWNQHTGPEWIFTDTPLSDHIFKDVFHQIINGLFQLHKTGIIHNDIHPSNILIAFNHQQEAAPMLIDFEALYFRQSIFKKSTLQSIRRHVFTGTDQQWTEACSATFPDEADTDIQYRRRVPAIHSPQFSVYGVYDYLSIPAHHGVRDSPLGDIEALIYSFMWAAGVVLPWKSVPRDSLHQILLLKLDLAKKAVRVDWEDCRPDQCPSWLWEAYHNLHLSSISCDGSTWSVNNTLKHIYKRILPDYASHPLKLIPCTPSGCVLSKDEQKRRFSKSKVDRHDLKQTQVDITPGPTAHSSPRTGNAARSRIQSSMLSSSSGWAIPLHKIIRLQKSTLHLSDSEKTDMCERNYGSKLLEMYELTPEERSNSSYYSGSLSSRGWGNTLQTECDTMVLIPRVADDAPLCATRCMKGVVCTEQIGSEVPLEPNPGPFIPDHSISYSPLADAFKSEIPCHSPPVGHQVIMELFHVSKNSDFQVLDHIIGMERRIATCFRGFSPRLHPHRQVRGYHDIPTDSIGIEGGGDTIAPDRLFYGRFPSVVEAMKLSVVFFIVGASQEHTQNAVSILKRLLEWKTYYPSLSLCAALERITVVQHTTNLVTLAENAEYATLDTGVIRHALLTSCYRRSNPLSLTPRYLPSLGDFLVQDDKYLIHINRFQRFPKSGDCSMRACRSISRVISRWFMFGITLEAVEDVRRRFKELSRDESRRQQWILQVKTELNDMMTVLLEASQPGSLS
eukprot:gnl/Dysnectes_brevis/5955_a8893_314.p1 GENE.gnl/Dysnectes_brevis/5955_a8893_314~~gnl/Dysnectes_brevis/5955_a8893_314.p1  ORF type:complete len:805 (+),score=74.47 gnl/Dysnectes_brevis/5955_a8893_314:24-2438(+)